jgi:YD repeat-containing protein
MNRPLAGDVGRIAMDNDGTNNYYDIRLPDGTVTRFRIYYGDEAVPVRISRPGAGPIAVDWSWPTAAEAEAGQRPKPLSAILYTCENVARLNPGDAANCTPAEIARFEYDAVAQPDDRGYRVRTVRVVQAKGSVNTYRKVLDKGDAVAGTDYDFRWLDTVQVVDLASDGTTAVTTELVARYQYAGRYPNASSGVYWMDDNLTEVQDAAGQWLLRLAYQNPADEVLLQDTVASVTTPRRTTTFTYFRDGLNEQATFIARTELRSGTSERVTNHWFDERGHLIRVRRPDYTELNYSYDYLGRMSEVVWPSGRTQQWVYASRTWGVDLEHPVAFAEIPAPESGLDSAEFSRPLTCREGVMRRRLCRAS